VVCFYFLYRQLWWVAEINDYETGNEGKAQKNKNRWRIPLEPFDLWNLLDKLMILRSFLFFFHNFFVYFSCWFLLIMIIIEKKVLVNFFIYLFIIYFVRYMMLEFWSVWYIVANKLLGLSTSYLVNMIETFSNKWNLLLQQMEEIVSICELFKHKQRHIDY